MRNKIFDLGDTVKSFDNKIGFIIYAEFYTSYQCYIYKPTFNSLRYLRNEYLRHCRMILIEKSDKRLKNKHQVIKNE